MAHRFPLSRGGETVFWNLVTLCMKCWRAKGKKTPQEFIDSYYFQFTILKRHIPEVETKRVRLVFENGEAIEGEMRVDSRILGEFSIRVKGKGMIRLFREQGIKEIDLLEDLTNDQAQVS